MRLIKRISFMMLLLCIFSFTTLAYVNKVSAKDYEFDEVSEVGGARYHVNSVVESNSLFGGVKHTKYVAESSSPFTGFSAAGSGGGGTNIADQYYPQSVNVLTIPSSKDVKIVNWTFTSETLPDKWTKATIVDMAKNFEANNPGWIVIAGINGDFFDINGVGSYGPLLYQTRGPSVNDGEVVRPINHSNDVIGFKNDGSVDNVVYNEEFTYSEFPYLTIYNDLGEEIAEFEVKHLNEIPAAGEISLYYNYAYDVDRFTITETPANSYFSQLSKRMLGMDSKNVYAKGTVNFVSESQTLTNNQFSLYTENEEVKALLDNSYEVRVQYKVTGEYADCESITAGNAPLMKNGEALYSTDKNRHPRTMIGYKEDGTAVFVTVDGRQPQNNMYGMTNMEMSATMQYYGCYAATNMDGGGSTTMIIRENNEFRVLNSPSDGNERRDSNAILVVMPALSLSISKATDTTVELNIPEFGQDVQVSNVKVTADGGQTYYSAENNQVIVRGLTPKTEYTLEYTYDITLNGSTSSRVGEPFKVKTGDRMATVEIKNWSWDGSNYHVELNVHDPDSVIQNVFVRASKNYFFDKNKGYVIDIPQTEKMDFDIVYKYNLKSEYSKTETGVITVINKMCFVELYSDDVSLEQTLYVVKEGDKFKLPDLSSYNVYFEGWELNGEIYKGEVLIEGPCTYTAVFKDLDAIGGPVISLCSSAMINLYLSMIPLCALILLKKKH